ncbi:MAG: hypothetical protein WBX01_13230 [Nitrososphaeraceae archaeon]
MEQPEALENAIRSKIERRTAENILTYLDFVLHDELLGFSEERRKIHQKVKNHCIKEGFYKIMVRHRLY